MSKILLMSILIATVAIPIAVARAKSTRVGLRKMVWAMSIYIFLWVFFCVYVYLRIGGGY